MMTRRRLLAGGAGLLPALAATSSLAAGGTAPADRARPHLRGSIDGTGLGLSPGASDDQSTAFREALQRAEASGRPLFLPPGRYDVANIELPERCHIVGIPGESRITFRGGRRLLSAENGRRLHLEGLMIDGLGRTPGDDAGGLVAARNVEDIVIRGCQVTATGGTGIRLEDSAGRIESTAVTGCGAVGIDLIGSRGLSVRDNTVSDIGDTGILVRRYQRGGDDTIVTGNRVSRIHARSGGTGQYGNGINVALADGVSVTDNRIDGCAFSAVRAYSSGNIRIANNTATASGEVALYVEFAHEGAVVSGNLVDDAGVGISFANFLEFGGRLSVCSGNLIRNLRPVSYSGDAQQGIGISAEADAALTGNIVENAAHCGLQLGWGPYLRDIAATGNVIRASPIGFAVSVVEGTRATLIADNLVSGATRGAVLGMHWHEIVTGDLARGGSEAFPHLSVERNRIS